MSRWPRRNRHDRRPSELADVSRRFDRGSKAWLRAARGEARRCVVRALRIAHRLVAGTRLRAVGADSSGSYAEVDVFVTARRRRDSWDAFDDLPRHGPIDWRGDGLGTFPTRVGHRIELSERLNAHPRDCECTTCTEIPF